PHPAAFERLERELGLAGPCCAHVADNPAKDFVAPRRLGWRTVRVRRPGGLHAGVPSGDDVDVEIPTLAELDAAPGPAPAPAPRAAPCPPRPRGAAGSPSPTCPPSPPACASCSTRSSRPCATGAGGRSASAPRGPTRPACRPRASTTCRSPRRPAA